MDRPSQVSDTTTTVSHPINDLLDCGQKQGPVCSKLHLWFPCQARQQQQTQTLTSSSYMQRKGNDRQKSEILLPSF